MKKFDQPHFVVNLTKQPNFELRLTHRLEDYAKSTQILILTKCEIVAIPNELRQLQQLVSLTLDDNQLTQLDSALLQLNLQFVSLKRNLISSLPEDFGRWRDTLKTLYLDGNVLKSIGEPICQLKRLDNLSIHNNSFTELPQMLCHMQLDLFYVGWVRYLAIPANYRLPGVTERGSVMKQLELMTLFSFRMEQQTLTFRQFLQRANGIVESLEVQIPMEEPNAVPDERWELRIRKYSTSERMLGSLKSLKEIKDPIDVIHRLITEPISMAIRLFDHGALMALVTQFDKNWDVPLSLAINEENYQAVNLLIQRPQMLNKVRDPALLLGIRKQELHLVKDLLQLGFDPNIVDEFGESALQVAFRYYSRDPEQMKQICHLLLIAGAYPNHRNPNTGNHFIKINIKMVLKSNLDALQFIMKYNYRQLQGCMLESVFLVYQRVLGSGDTVLHLSIRKTTPQILDFLILHQIGNLFDNNWRDQSLADALFHQEGRKKRLYQSGMIIEPYISTMLCYLRKQQKCWLRNHLLHDPEPVRLMTQHNQDVQSLHNFQEDESDSCPSIPDDDDDRSPFKHNKIQDFVTNQDPTAMGVHDQASTFGLMSQEASKRFHMAETFEEVVEIDEFVINQIMRSPSKLPSNLQRIDAYNRAFNRIQQQHMSHNEMQQLMLQINTIQRSRPHVEDIQAIFLVRQVTSQQEAIELIIKIRIQLHRLRFIEGILSRTETIRLLKLDDEVALLSQMSGHEPPSHSDQVRWMIGRYMEAFERLCSSLHVPWQYHNLRNYPAQSARHQEKQDWAATTESRMKAQLYELATEHYSKATVFGQWQMMLSIR